MTKVSSYGAVGLLVAALLGGAAYILLNPTEVQSQGPTDGQGRGRSEIAQGSAGTANGSTAYGQGQPGQGRGRGNEGAAAQGQGALGGESFDGEGASDGRGQGQGQGRNATVRIVEWETLTGKVTAIDGDVTIQTAEGEALVGMGQSAYREGFDLAVGDEITVLGFHEDGEFKARSVENLATGETITLRDETGRPMWSGQGRLKNQGSSGD
ncbi:MAG: hypothetical protein DRJ03_21460 [Chloroflexi bacterium]|nr:MAG: hypothetical protein DRI81_14405 [Chloroflexota bacterium]RLC80570.1 MAG: hypothetical protein DRJ03_21460 [Chloroflexota bacterium]